jgi:DNA-binding NtrC family response regulator
VPVGVVISDADGTTTCITDTSSRFLDISIEDSVGKLAADVVPNSRINVISLAIPLLRERREDILPPACPFIEKTVKGPEGKGIRIRKAVEGAIGG